MNAPACLSAMRQTTMRWPQTKMKLVEDAANGPAIASMLHAEIPGILLWPPKGHSHRNSSKDEKLASISYLIQAKNVYIPEDSAYPWVEPFVHEHAVFPNGVNDDQCDTTAMALEYLRPKGKSAMNHDWAEAMQENTPALSPRTIMVQQMNKSIKQALRKDQQKRLRAESSLYPGRIIKAW